VELRNLRTFLTIVEQGSYLRAAEALGYTQSTLTAQIQQLEQELGFPLFERIGRRMVLTEMGRQALERSRTLIQLSEELTHMGEGPTASGVLRVDMAETLLCYGMTPVLRAFRSRAPQVHLIIRSVAGVNIVENVRRGICDLGVGYNEDWQRPPFLTDPLGTCSMALLAAPDYPWQDFDTPHQSLPATLITDEPDCTFRIALENHFHRQDIVLSHTMELWSIETIKRCVLAGLGFTYLPRFIAEEELNRGALAEIPFSLSAAPVNLLCIRHKNHQLTPAMALFISLLQENFGTFS